MPISDARRLLFVHVAKAAGTSLLRHLGMEEASHAPWYIYVQDPRWQTYRKFAVTRDPFDRLASSYEYACMFESYWHSKSSSEHVKPQHLDYEICSTSTLAEVVGVLEQQPQLLLHPSWWPQHKFVCDDQHNFMLDVRIRYEHLNEDLAQHDICKDLPRLNASPRKLVADYYNKDLFERVRKLYAVDLELFYPAFLCMDYDTYSKTCKG